MEHKALTISPVKAPVQKDPFNLAKIVLEALSGTQNTLQHGDVLAVSSKYAAISQGRVIDLDSVEVSPYAAELAERYIMHPQMTELIVREADHIFGGIIHEFNGKELGFLLTMKDGIVSANAGLDRSNVPAGQVVLFPEHPYKLAAELRRQLRELTGVDLGIILTDSWLMPGRTGTTGVALATAGFHPVIDERGKPDLFGNPMQVTQRGVADQLCAAAQIVMGESNESTPIVLLCGAGVTLTDDEITVDDVAIDWQMDIYVGALTDGLLPDGAPQHSTTARLLRRHDIMDG